MIISSSLPVIYSRVIHCLNSVKEKKEFGLCEMSIQSFKLIESYIETMKPANKLRSTINMEFVMELILQMRDYISSLDGKKELLKQYIYAICCDNQLPTIMK